MQVINYLKQHGLKALEEEFFIKVKEYEEGLIVLNYNQIDSPKSHPIVMECRGLILDKDFNVVSRSFDRFFNLGEQPDTQKHIDMAKAVCYEKIDGSLIRLYYWKNVWYVATRGTAFAESEVNGFPITFKELVFKALGVFSDDEFQDLCKYNLNPNVTYICEIVSTENRVVKKYSGYTLYFLSARGNHSFDYIPLEQDSAVNIGMKLIQSYRFKSTEECLETAKHLKDLDEGYVLYQDGVPVCKIKSPVYVAVHNIRGEGLNPKRIAQIILSGETDEYLKYFPEDESFFTKYLEAYSKLKYNIVNSWGANSEIEDQKTFAIAVKDFSYSSVMFQTKKSKLNPLDVFESCTEPSKIRMLESFVEEGAA